MNNEDNNNKYDIELRSVAGQIINIVQNNESSFSESEQEQILLCNKSMEFWIMQNNPQRALVEARHTLKLLKEITEF